MNKNNKMGALRFAYICGKEHRLALITENQYEQIKNILYGNKAKETA